eukprot:1946679-Amphidinium_carterae.1
MGSSTTGQSHQCTSMSSRRYLHSADVTVLFKEATQNTPKSYLHVKYDNVLIQAEWHCLKQSTNNVHLNELKSGKDTRCSKSRSNQQRQWCWGFVKPCPLPLNCSRKSTSLA